MSTLDRQWQTAAVFDVISSLVVEEAAAAQEGRQRHAVAGASCPTALSGGTALHPANIHWIVGQQLLQ
jgi:hypothetical protein